MNVWKLAVALACFAAAEAMAQAPQLINYQGRLLNGTNLANGNIGLSLRLFDQPTNGNRLYEDSNTVAVSDGLYSTFLGDNTTAGSLATALGATNLFLEVAVNGAALSPRERVVSVAYSFNAQTAQGVVPGGITSQMLAAGAVASVNIATGAVTSLSIAAGAVTTANLGSNSVTTATLADGAVTAAKVLQAAVNLPLLATITNPAPVLNGNFGYAVTVLGTNRFLVTAINDGTNSAGQAFLYDLNGGFIQAITNPMSASGDNFGTAVACVGGNRFIVGAPNNDTGAANAGCAHLYDFNGNLLATITNPTPQATDNFGQSAAAVGSNRFVIGAPGDRTGALQAGSVYLYNSNGVLQTTVNNPSPSATDNFGQSVAGVGTNRFVVGEPNFDVGTNGNCGIAHLYDFNGNLIVTITNPAPASGDNFGSSFAAVGANRFVIGAPNDSAGASGAGSVYLYDVNGALIATITNPAPVANEKFGAAIAGVGNNRFAVGVSGLNVGSTANAGGIYVFDYDGNLLASLKNPAPSLQASFGSSIAFAGNDRIVIGTPMDNTGATGAGVAGLYQMSGYAAGIIAEGVRAGGVTVDMLSSAVETRYVHSAGDTMTGNLTVPLLTATAEIVTPWLTTASISASGPVSASAMAPGNAGTNIVSQVGELTRRTAPIAYLVSTGTTAIAATNMYNCTAARLGGGTYRITFAAQPASAFYSPAITPVSSAPCFVSVTNTTVANFDFVIFGTNGLPQDAPFRVIVFGGY